MNRLAYGLVTTLAGFAFLGGSATATATSADDPGVATGGTGDISRLAIRIAREKVPATGLAQMRIGIRNSKSTALENVRLVVTTSNWRVPTARKITFRGVEANESAWTGLIGVTPGPKARGEVTVTVSHEDLEASDSITVTPPTPNAENWKKPGWPQR